VGQDAAGDVLVLDHRHETHRTRAPGADEDLQSPRPFHQLTPIEIPSASGIVGARDLPVEHQETLPWEIIRR
jgi:hypothetical protein